MTRPIYGGSRFPKIVEKGKCRGCQAPVPKNRQTWCSTDCYRKYDPEQVRRATFKRDGHKCQQCGLDFHEAEKEWRNKMNEASAKNDWPLRCKLSRMKPRPEFDHIVPFCEGGLTVLENMRTLCHDCHTKRTADWHKERAEKRRLVVQPELFISPSLPARGEGEHE